MLVIIVLFSNGKKEPNIYREQTTNIYIVNLKIEITKQKV